MSKNIDWSNLGFGFSDVNCHVKAVWKDGAWGRLELTGASAMSIVGVLGIAYGGAGGSYGEVVLDDDAANVPRAGTDG